MTLPDTKQKFNQMLNETFVSFVGLIWKLCIPVEENNNSTHSYTPKQREPRSITYKNIVFFYFFLQFLVVRLTNIPDQPPSFSKNQWQQDKNDLQSKQALEAVICQTIRDCEQSVFFFSKYSGLACVAKASMKMYM